MWLRREDVSLPFITISWARASALQEPQRRRLILTGTDGVPRGLCTSRGRRAQVVDSLTGDSGDYQERPGPMRMGREEDDYRPVGGNALGGSASSNPNSFILARIVRGDRQRKSATSSTD